MRRSYGFMAAVLVVFFVFITFSLAAEVDKKPYVTSVTVETFNPDGSFVGEQNLSAPTSFWPTARRGGRINLLLKSENGTVIMRVELGLSEDGKFFGNVPHNISGGVIGCNITDRVVICAVTKKETPGYSRPLVTLWQDHGRFIYQPIQ
jgi:hypothetical protein